MKNMVANWVHGVLPSASRVNVNRCLAAFYSQTTTFLLLHNSIMQTYEDSEPIVRIRDYKQDRVNFVLENVDLAYALQLYVTNLAE
jgi:hypothetical protein